jgi:hypothetical protein
MAPARCRQSASRRRHSNSCFRKLAESDTACLLEISMPNPRMASPVVSVVYATEETAKMSATDESKGYRRRGIHSANGLASLAACGAATVSPSCAAPAGWAIRADLLAGRFIDHHDGYVSRGDANFSAPIGELQAVIMAACRAPNQTCFSSNGPHRLFPVRPTIGTVRPSCRGFVRPRQRRT